MNKPWRNGGDEVFVDDQIRDGEHKEYWEHGAW